MKKLLLTLLGLFIATNAFAATPALQVFQGGTGSSTLTGILIGNGTSSVQSLILGSNLTLSGTTLSSTGGGGSPYPFNPNNATTSTVGFLNGISAVGSSTIQDLHSTYASTTQLSVTGTATTTFAGGASAGIKFTGDGSCITGPNDSIVHVCFDEAAGLRVGYSNLSAMTHHTYTSGVIQALITDVEVGRWNTTGLFIQPSYGLHGNGSSTLNYFNSASSSIDILRVNTRAGVATSTPGKGAAFGVTGDAFFSGEVFASNVADSALTGTSCVGESSGLLNTNNCVTSIGQTYGSAQNGVITFASSTTAISGDWGLTNSGGTFTFNIPSSSASNRGLLTAADWTTFNNKAGFAYPFTNGSGYFATTTGAVFNASSTIQNLNSTTVTIPSITSNVLAVGTGGLVYGFATSTDSYWLYSTSTAGSGTTTMKGAGYKTPTTFTSIGCSSRGGGTFVVALGDSTSSTTAQVSSTGLTTTYTTVSYSFTSGESVWWAFGSVSGTVTDPTCSYTR